uniref:Uncharacterized protein n=1 Tax=Oryza rufipogon TaxID=4529 RepID=A0A0E0R6G1_ORYRU
MRMQGAAKAVDRAAEIERGARAGAVKVGAASWRTGVSGRACAGPGREKGKRRWGRGLGPLPLWVREEGEAQALAPVFGAAWSGSGWWRQKRAGPGGTQSRAVSGLTRQQPSDGCHQARVRGKRRHGR